MHWLGVEQWGKRPRAKRLRVEDFPMLRHQIRCETGFKLAPFGVFRHAGVSQSDAEAIAAARARCDLADIPVVPVIETYDGLCPNNRPARLLVLLHELHQAGEATLPTMRALGELLAPTKPARQWGTIAIGALERLAELHCLTLETGGRKQYDETPRVVTLRNGHVLRTAPPPARTTRKTAAVVR